MALTFLYRAFCRLLQVLRRLGRDRTELAVKVVMLRHHEVMVLRRQIARPALQPSSRVWRRRVLLPDSKSMILLKAGARRVRNEDRDATDLRRCLEVANADCVTALDFTSSDFAQIRDQLQRELGRGGAGLEVITRDLPPEAAGQTATRIQVLLGRIVGV